MNRSKLTQNTLSDLVLLKERLLSKNIDMTQNQAETNNNLHEFINVALQELKNITKNNETNL